MGNQSEVKFRVREARLEDEGAIDEVVARAFQAEPLATGREVEIVQTLRSKKRLRLMMVAELRETGEVVGCLALSPVKMENQATGWFGLGPVAVVPKWQRSGVGSTMIQMTLATLQMEHANGCVVLGEPSFYQRLGFKVLPKLTLPGTPEGYFLALPMDGTNPEGRVFYHATFGKR